MSNSPPILTKLSSYQSTPKWTISTSNFVRSKLSCDVMGPAAYNPTTCMNKTSKFREISYACNFGTSKRWGSESGKGRDERGVPGPGTYSPPADYSQSPYVSVSNISFGKGGRVCFGKQCVPSPSTYDIRGKHRLGGFTFDPRGVSVNNRHGWYYDADINSVKMNPGPGQYSPKYPIEQAKIGFGTGDRPKIYLSTNTPSPGRYDIRSKLGGPAHSFTTDVSRSIKRKQVEPSLCSQPTQFG